MNKSALPETVLIIGSGYVGTALGNELVRSGHKVFGVTRSVEKAGRRLEKGWSPLLMDMLQPATVDALPRADCVVALVAPDNHSVEEYENTYLGISHNVIRYVNETNPEPRLIYASSTSVYGSRTRQVDESTPCEPDHRKGEILMQAERMLMEQVKRTAVIRLAGIYGPGRNRIVALQKGEWPKSENNRYLNLIHVKDAVAIIREAMKRNRAGSELVLGCDGRPVTVKTLYTYLCGALGIPERKKLRERAGGKRCRSLKLKSWNYRFLVPDYRVGYGKLLAGKRSGQ